MAVEARILWKALHVLEVIRDADNDCGKDGLPHNLPPHIRKMVDAVLESAGIPKPKEPNHGSPTDPA